MKLLIPITEAFLISSAFAVTLRVLFRCPSESGITRVTVGLMVLGALVQLYLSGHDWQTWPTYCACILLLLFCFTVRHATPTNTITVGLVCTVLLASSTAFLFILPSFRLPRPTGTFAVGTTIIHLVDSSRSDQAFRSGKRELMVQVWYPTDTQAGILAPYRRRQETTLLSSYMAAIKTHSYTDVPITVQAPTLPLVLFNPAWGGQRTQNTVLVEELASHGFIVAAIDHTHNSLPISFPGGEVFNIHDPQLVHDPDSISLSQQVSFYNQELERQVLDDSFVLDRLEISNETPGDLWFHRIDTHRLGVLGHSFGGAVAVDLAFVDTRIRSAINLDGWNFGQLANAPLKKPLMLIYEQGAPPTSAFNQTPDAAIRRVPLDAWDEANVHRTLSEYGGIMIAIHGAKHFNFSDRALYSPIRKLTEAGLIEPARAHLIINSFVVAFFTETLKGVYQPLLHGAKSQFPEVTQEEWKPTEP